MKASRPGTPIIDRLARLYEVRDNGCWQWIANIDHQGYGAFVIRVGGRGVRKSAHRIVYSVVVGDIEPGLVLDHLCRNRACVNPDHLEQVTDAVNRFRGAHKGAKSLTHCMHGHAFDEANTYHYKGKRGCRTCNRAAQARRAARRRLEAKTP